MKTVLVASLMLFVPNAFSDAGFESSPGMGSGGSAGQSGSAMMQQMMGAGMNAAQGAQLQSECAAGEKWACQMAAQSFAQAMQMLMEAMMSGNTSTSASGNYDFETVDFSDYSSGFEDTGVGDNPKELEAFIAEGMGNLAGNGYKYDAKTGTLSTPDGEFDMNEIDTSSPGAMVGAMGGSASDMKMAESTAQGLSDSLAKKFGAKDVKPSVSGVGLNTAGGGYSYGSGGKSAKSYFNPLNRKPSSASKEQIIAGKSRRLGNDSIGIKVDNIFSMVHRRYQSKRKTNNFLEPIISDKSR